MMRILNLFRKREIGGTFDVEAVRRVVAREQYSDGIEAACERRKRHRPIRQAAALKREAAKRQIQRVRDPIRNEMVEW